MTRTIEHQQVDFTARCLQRLKHYLASTELKSLSKQFCVTEEVMLHAIHSKQILIGILNSFHGRRCVFLEYNGIQLVAPVYERH